jgi:hypothetical protein
MLSNVVNEIRVMLRLTPEMHARLVELAKRETRSLHGQILYMVKRQLDESPETPPST